MKRLSENAIRTIIGVCVSVVCTAILALMLLSVPNILELLVLESESNTLWILMGIGFFLLTGFEFLLFFKQQEKPLKIGRTVKAIICLVLGILTFVFIKNIDILVVNSIVYFCSLIAFLVIYVFCHHRVRDIAFNTIVLLILLLFLLVCIVAGTLFSTLVMALTIAFIMLNAIIREAFSKIRFATLKDVLRKTYAFEILLGLVSLIIAFSLVFYVNEGISFGDALWLCFSIVTTIGFGDITITSPLSRVLAVILGIYGIIVVALITSIIVNFYNETKYIGKKDKADIIDDDEEEQENDNQNQ